MSRARDSQLEVLRRAQELAETLTAAPETAVKRSAFLSLVADFIANPESEPARLLELLERVKQGSGGHLQRGKTYAPQIELAAASVAAEVERGGLTPQQLRSLFGWTARLLEVRRGGKPSRKEQGSPGVEKPGGQKPDSSRPKQERRASGAGLGTLGDKLGPLLNSLKKPGGSHEPKD